MKRLLILAFLLTAPCHAQDYAFGNVASNGATMGATSGTVQFRLNACGAGWTERTDLADKTILVTTAAAMDVGTTGGSNTITPTVNSLTAAAQTVSSLTAAAQVHSGITASFAGNALGTHAHELPLHGGTTPRITAGYGTGTSIAGTRSLTNAAQTTSQAVLLSQAVSAGTPAGTVNITSQGTNTTSAVTGTMNSSAVTGTLNSFDNRSAWVKLIVCTKD